jgi:D-alanine-D-alanine ligase
MIVGLSYDLKTTVNGQYAVDDALEEYDSPETVELITSALESRGHRVIELGGGERFLDNIRREKIDIVFNIAEGRGSYRSREAQVPAVLEMLDIPYIGSDPQCLAVCLDKPVTKKLVAMECVITPKWLVTNNGEDLKNIPWERIAFPVIVKPAYEGSSKGIRLTSIAYDVNEVVGEIGRLLHDYRQPVMVEEFIDGDEVTVGIIGNSPPEIVGMMRVLPKSKVEHFVYSVEVKRDYLNQVEYECPVALPGDVIAGLETAGLKIFETLGCRDFSRIDFRVGRNGIPYFIEINPLPGLGSYSDLIIMALKMGWTHDGLINAVLDAALQRYPQCVSA